MLIQNLAEEKLPIEYGWRTALLIYLRRLFFVLLFVLAGIISLISLGRVPVYILLPLLSLMLLGPPILLIFSANKKLRKNILRFGYNRVERIPKRKTQFRIRIRSNRPQPSSDRIRFGPLIRDFAITTSFIILVGFIASVLWSANKSLSIVTTTVSTSRVVNLRWPPGETEVETKVFYPPDGSSIVVAVDSLATYTYDSSSLNIVSRLPISDSESISLSADANILASVFEWSDIQILSWPKAEVLRVIKASAFIQHTALSSDGTLLATATMNEDVVRLWHVSDGSLISTLEGHIDPVNSLAFSPDNLILATGSEDETVRLWRTSDGAPILTLGRPKDNMQVSSSGNSQTITRTFAKDPVRSVEFSPDGKTLAAGTFWGEIKLWKLSERKLIRTLAYVPVFNTNDGLDLANVIFSPDGMLVAAGLGEQLVVWKVEDGEQYLVLQGHSDLVRSIAFAPDGKTIVSTSWDRTMRVWPIKPPTP